MMKFKNIIELSDRDTKKLLQLVFTKDGLDPSDCTGSIAYKPRAALSLLRMKWNMQKDGADVPSQVYDQEQALKAKCDIFNAWQDKMCRRGLMYAVPHESGCGGHRVFLSEIGRAIYLHFKKLQ